MFRVKKLLSATFLFLSKIDFLKSVSLHVTRLWATTLAPSPILQNLKIEQIFLLSLPAQKPGNQSNEDDPGYKSTDYLSSK
jgi:hypothetical protein